MRAARKLASYTVEEYLAGELRSPIKHDYLDGFIHAMAGASNAHSIIAGNIFAALHGRLRGKPCRPFNADTKIRIRLSAQTRFYYPDCSVVCRPNSQQDSFQDEPTILVEVLSRSTRRVDFHEKRDAYESIPSFRAYLLVEQEAAGVVVYRRGPQGFVREDYLEVSDVIPLGEVAAELPLAEIYDGVEFVPEPEPPQ